MSSITTSSGSNFTYGTLDANKQTITINSDGIYTLGCIKASHSSTSVTNRTYYIVKYASDGTTVLDQTTDLVAVSTVQIGIKAGNKIAFFNSPNNVTWNNNNVPSYWTIIPVTQGFPG